MPVLIAAPTGLGKTLAAFLVCIDRLLRDGREGRLGDELLVLVLGRVVPTREGDEIRFVEDAALPAELAAEIAQALRLDGTFRDRFSSRLGGSLPVE